MHQKAKEQQTFYIYIVFYFINNSSFHKKESNTKQYCVYIMSTVDVYSFKFIVKCTVKKNFFSVQWNSFFTVHNEWTRATVENWYKNKHHSVACLSTHHLNQLMNKISVLSFTTMHSWQSYVLLRSIINQQWWKDTLLCNHAHSI